MYEIGKKNLSPSEKNLLTQIFRFFTQADVEVSNCYIRHYMNVFKPTEVLMMMSSFASMETVHIAAYSHLLDTIGMPESEYSAFMKYKEMKDKYDYMQGFDVKSNHDIVYICVGYGEEEENIKTLVKELDLETQVMFFKDISNDLKNALVSKSNIFVMPSIIHKKSVEGFGIAYVEAAQYGVPSIGGKDGGAADAIDHEKTGLICDGNKLDDIYSSINSMLENKKYLELGKNAKEFVNKFQWSKIIEEYKKILN